MSGRCERDSRVPPLVVLQLVAVVVLAVFLLRGCWTPQPAVAESPSQQWRHWFPSALVGGMSMPCLRSEVTKDGSVVGNSLGSEGLGSGKKAGAGSVVRLPSTVAITANAVARDMLIARSERPILLNIGGIAGKRLKMPMLRNLGSRWNSTENFARGSTARSVPFSSSESRLIMSTKRGIYAVCSVETVIPASDSFAIVPSSSPQPSVICVVPAYNRADWMRRGWIDEDRDCQDTRQEVLARQSTLPVVWDEGGCKVLSGAWKCPYTGRLFSDPKKLDVDHMVPLANAHVSGGWAWGELKREHYANWLRDPCHLMAVEARANRQKGAKGPEDWLPEKNRCTYVRCWLGVKEESDLTLTAREARKVAEVLKGCP